MSPDRMGLRARTCGPCSMARCAHAEVWKPRLRDWATSRRQTSRDRFRRAPSAIRHHQRNGPIGPGTSLAAGLQGVFRKSDDGRHPPNLMQRIIDQRTQSAGLFGVPVIPQQALQPPAAPCALLDSSQQSIYHGQVGRQGAFRVLVTRESRLFSLVYQEETSR